MIELKIIFRVSGVIFTAYMYNCEKRQLLEELLVKLYLSLNVCTQICECLKEFTILNTHLLIHVQ